MHLSIPSYPDPRNPGTTLTNAIASINRACLEIGNQSYWLDVWIFASATAYNTVPPPPYVDRFVVHSGDVLVPASGNTPAKSMPSYADLDTQAAAAIKADTTGLLTPQGSQATVLYGLLLNHPKLQGATLVTP